MEAWGNIGWTCAVVVANLLIVPVGISMMDGHQIIQLDDIEAAP